jgi:hypothetical protein
MCGFYVSLLYVFLLFSWFRFGCSFGVLVLLFFFWVWDEVISFSISPRERERVQPWWESLSRFQKLELGIFPSNGRQLGNCVIKEELEEEEF